MHAYLLNTYTNMSRPVLIDLSRAVPSISTKRMRPWRIRISSLGIFLAVQGGSNRVFRLEHLRTDNVKICGSL